MIGSPEMIRHSPLKIDMGDPSLALYLPLWYESPDLTGTTIYSLCKNRHICTVKGAALWTPHGRYFDGTDDYITIPTNTSFDSVRTVCAWIKITGGAGQDRYIVSRGLEGPSLSGGEWGFSVYSNNRIRYHMYIGGSWRYFNGTATPALNTWHFVTETYDDVALRGYMNNVSDGSQAQTGALGTGTKPVGIGDTFDGSGNYGFVGIIGAVWAYTRALTSIEDQYNYQSTAWRYR